LFAELNQVFGWDRFPYTTGLFDQSLSPAIDVVESTENCTLSADLPGVNKNEIELTIASNVLTLKGEKKSLHFKKDDTQKDNDRIFRDETWHGTFQRSITLPDSIDPEKVTADFSDGVLRVVIGKKAELQPRQIQVEAR